MALPHKDEARLIVQIDAEKQCWVYRAEVVLQHHPLIRVLITKRHIVFVIHVDRKQMVGGNQFPPFGQATVFL